jgi:hypothetical protein
MAIRVPDPHKKPLARLADLSDTQVAALDHALRTVSPAISPRALADNVRAVPEVGLDLPTGELSAILSVLLSLALAQRRQQKSLDEFVADVLRAAKAQDLAKLTSEPDSIDTLERKLALLLRENQIIEITARAGDVFFAHEELYATSRVLSDLRPIFATDDAVVPTVGMIVHNLELSVAGSGERARHYIAMNVHDLRELRRVVDRALAKDQALRRVIEAAGMTYIEDVPNEHQRTP